MPLSCLLFIIVLSACHKNFPENRPANRVPVILATSITKIQTRVDGSSFEKEDKIGLFILEQPKKIVEDRHTDNVQFTFNGMEWVAENEVFYPEGDSKSTFLAYYPFLSEGVPPGKSTIVYKTKSDQSIAENYTLSDFLVAEINDVEPTESEVSLNFKHKLTAIEIVLDPGNAFASAPELLDAHPQILIKGIHTDYEYDFLNGKFSGQSGRSDIIPAGEFTVKDNKLTGKKCVIVPQTISAGHILIELTAGNKNYSFTLGEEYQFLSGTRETYTLTLAASNAANIPGKISVSVSDWDNELSQSGTLTEKEEQENTISDCYSIAIPSFSESSVYKVMNGKTQIAEICKEYLVAKNIENQAIVAYPTSKGQTDLTRGIVLQILEGTTNKILSGAVHGGTVSWNMDSGLLTYTKGALQPFINVYIDAKGNFKNVPDGGSITVAIPEPDILTDTRDNIQYRIVKIGTHYWMGENLKATTFTDGTPIEWKESNKDWKGAIIACCRYKESNEILYKHGAILDKICPEGWKVPSIAEWNRLITYVAANAVLLKNSSWGVTDNKLNLSGFSAVKIGLRSSDGSFYDGMSGFWHNEGGYAYLSNGSISVYKDENTSGCSIRCIRK